MAEGTSTSSGNPQGRCVFGDACWNPHIPPAKSEAPSDKPASAGTSRAPPTKEPPKSSFAVQPKYEPKFCSLQRKSPLHPPNWVDAPEFVPKTPKSYADTLKSPVSEEAPPELCSYYAEGGECPFGAGCPYVHGDMCEICQKACLHPSDAGQRRAHTELCEQELEQDMELSFAVQRSRDKACGICMDVILEKEPLSERRFGILEKCSHVFCLACIRRWRQVKSLEAEGGLDPVVTRACPECRVASDFITPSQFWVETDEEKGRLIASYKVALSQKPCKYFKQGKGTCPFGGACFYLHARPDGSRVSLPPPAPRRRRLNQEGELDSVGRIFLWDYLEFREDNLLLQLELDDLVYSDSASDTSSENNFFLSESF